MKVFSIEPLKRFLCGTTAQPVSLRKQISRLITFCCVAVVLIQSSILASMLFHQYIRQEKEDTLYILENTHTKINSGFQYMEDLVLILQDQTGLQDFFRTGDFDADAAAECLKTSASLFSERNQMSSSEPLIEKIYLFNFSGDSIYNLYYPVTLSKIEAEQETYTRLNEALLNNDRHFYFACEDDFIHLCLRLYNSEMQPLGTCIFTLNKAGIEKNYEIIEKYRFYSWSIATGEQTILNKEQLPERRTGSRLEHTLTTGFGLTLYTGVPVSVVYDTLSSTLGMIFLISAAIILMLSYLGHSLAVFYVKPLETIAEKIKLVGKGNFDTKLSESSTEELQNISVTFNDMTEEIQHLIKENYETRLIAQQAEIQYLQSQMNPHFLSNALTMIQMKAALSGDKEVPELLHKLAGLYQGKIFRKDEYFISLREEMEIVEFYLSLQTSRFGDKMTSSISYEGNAEHYNNLQIPRLSIEPLVENAVCHGLIPKAEKGMIHIDISKTPHTLKITITDDGVGFSSDSAAKHRDEKNHTHVGLWNTNKMIQNLCGDEFGLIIESTPGHGTAVQVLLPIKLEDTYVESNDCRR